MEGGGKTLGGFSLGAQNCLVFFSSVVVGSFWWRIHQIRGGGGGLVSVVWGLEHIVSYTFQRNLLQVLHFSKLKILTIIFFVHCINSLNV